MLYRTHGVQLRTYLSEPLGSPVERIRAALLSELSEPLSLAEIADLVRMSREHCVRLFSKHFGVAPFRFRMFARVERARSLLATGMRPTRVAFECGFADQSHLNRAFKKVTGLTPGQFAMQDAIENTGARAVLA